MGLWAGLGDGVPEGRAGHRRRRTNSHSPLRAVEIAKPPRALADAGVFVQSDLCRFTEPKLGR